MAVREGRVNCSCCGKEQAFLSYPSLAHSRRDLVTAKTRCSGAYFRSRMSLPRPWTPRRLLHTISTGAENFGGLSLL
jgi:hypothetical protein